MSEGTDSLIISQLDVSQPHIRQRRGSRGRESQNYSDVCFLQVIVDWLSHSSGSVSPTSFRAPARREDGYFHPALTRIEGPFLEVENSHSDLSSTKLNRCKAFYCHLRAAGPCCGCRHIPAYGRVVGKKDREIRRSIEGFAGSIVPIRMRVGWRLECGDSRASLLAKFLWTPTLHFLVLQSPVSGLPKGLEHRGRPRGLVPDPIHNLTDPSGSPRKLLPSFDACIDNSRQESHGLESTSFCLLPLASCLLEESTR